MAVVAQQAKKYKDYKLITNNYTRTGYLFNGWNTKADGLGEGYGDGGTINVSENTTLYAQWLEDGGSSSQEAGITIQRAYELAYTANDKGMYVKNQDGSYHEMQDGEIVPGGTDTRFAMQDIGLEYNGTKVCDLVTVIGDQYQALDVRDWKLYYISKLADGRCWMTQNLDLDLSTNETLTTDTTDIPVNWTPSVSTNDPFMDEHNNDYAPGSVDPGNYYWNGVVSSSGNTSDYPDPASFENTGNVHYHIGNFYSFSAAVAMNGTSSIGERIVVDQSICPKGWKNPDVSSTAGSVNHLAMQFSDPLLRTAPFYLLPAGYYQSIYINDNTSIEYRGNQVYGSGNTAYLTLNSTSKSLESTTNGVVTSYTQARAFHPAGFTNPYATIENYPSLPRFLMLPIRCIAR